MNDDRPTSRVPLIAGMAALALLGAGGGFLYSQSRSTTPDNDKTSQASSAASDAASKAGISDAERKATEAIVRAYILEHPEILTEAAQILQQREVAARLSSAGGALTKPFASAIAGNPNGDIVLVEFTDYNCGFCRSSVADVQKLIDADKGLKVVFREVPILSSTSRDAGRWALAAARQGKYMAFHNAMFAGERPSEASIRAAARAAGLDMARAEKDAASAEIAAELDANVAMMRQLGVGGTPTFVVGDQIVEGAVGHGALKAAISKARKAT